MILLGIVLVVLVVIGIFVALVAIGAALRDENRP